ncbi:MULTISPECIES: precorrin-6A/cobalt-precorrin-6A reductase [Prochlorococcus]|uniref:precorrin-6A/cobalt-precorrin-6A reductase n=1 Tax=Prochlorococcus TaxID=1218 RepID=UPI0005339A89|nr:MULTISPECIES: precorrin-6A/cobalt-precorrin-6A reductase [Prochlorococcus]KGG12888.1 Cobalt-precorrin-6x reductase [Prochlorococcus sp. MIT 0601]
MHSRKNCHLHIWLLTGTQEGPELAKAFIDRGCKVSVSVVSYEASLSYFGLGLESLWVGSLKGVEEISLVLSNAQENHNGFDYVIDATHPFARIISSDLRKACLIFGQIIIRYERYCENLPGANFIRNFHDLSSFNLKGKKLLLAIGSKYLSECLNEIHDIGAIPFARVLPRVSSFAKALSCKIPEENLAILQPLTSSPEGAIEKALCRSWNINGVICRESGGGTQRLWQSICKAQNIKLWLISRPTAPEGILVADTLVKLLQYIGL